MDIVTTEDQAKRLLGDSGWKRFVEREEVRHRLEQAGVDVAGTWTELDRGVRRVVDATPQPCVNRKQRRARQARAMRRG